PKIINGSRRARIAKGSGVAIGEVSQLVTNFFEGQKQMKAVFGGGGLPGMPPGMAGMARRANKSARKKAANKKKAPRSGNPARAAELARGGGQRQDQAPANGPGGPGGLGNLGGLGGGLPEGLSAENLAEQLSKMPSNLNFPPPNQGPQGNVPAAFRGGGKR